jgi:hypothetical protein
MAASWWRKHDKDHHLKAMIVAHFDRIAASTEATKEAEQMEEENPGEHQQWYEERHLYRVEDIFSSQDLYWIDYARGERFDSTLENGILYRPKIVDELANKVNAVLGLPVRKGIMVKGPQGVGKSHSLVSLVRKLLYGSKNKYLVTFIPDCNKWNDADYLLEAICASFGATPASAFGFDSERPIEQTQLRAFIKKIDTALTACKKQWVFIFDQVNTLFNKPLNRHAEDASGFDFPFFMIDNVTKPGRITSLIAASTNNEMAYKDKYEGFDEYNHITSMNSDELTMAFDCINENNIQEVLNTCDGIPLYSLSYVKQPMAFQTEINEAVYNSLLHLRPRTDYDKPQWELVQNSIFSCLLGISSYAFRYDKKFLIRDIIPTSAGTSRYYRPLFPAVLSAYRRHLWNELMQFVEVQEHSLLNTCIFLDTTNDTRGRIFEAIVIRRFQGKGVEIQVGGDKVQVPSSSNLFPGMVLPELSAQSADGIYIPFNPNFPAIDLVWKLGKIIFGVQVHVSSHEDVASRFCGLCEKAGWFQNFDTIYLLYLGPEDNVTNLVAALVNPPSFETRMTRDNTVKNQIVRRAISKDSISCLVDLKWPDGCSLSGNA